MQLLWVPSFPVFTSVLLRSQTLVLLEYPGEVVVVLYPAVLRDHAYGHLSALQKMLNAMSFESILQKAALPPEETKAINDSL